MIQGLLERTDELLHDIRVGHGLRWGGGTVALGTLALGLKEGGTRKCTEEEAKHREGIIWYICVGMVD